MCCRRSCVTSASSTKPSSTSSSTPRTRSKTSIAGPAVAVASPFATWVDQGDAAISITDDGCGIPADILDKIFDPFFTTKEIGRGSGQGLAISRSVIVDKHRGRLDVATEVGEGTTFTIRLPIAGVTTAIAA